MLQQELNVSPFNSDSNKKNSETNHINTMTATRFPIYRRQRVRSTEEDLEQAKQWTGAMRIAIRDKNTQHLEKVQLNAKPNSREREENIIPYILLTGVGMLLLTILGVAPQ